MSTQTSTGRRRFEVAAFERDISWGQLADALRAETGDKLHGVQGTPEGLTAHTPTAPGRPSRQYTVWWDGTAEGLRFHLIPSAGGELAQHRVLYKRYGANVSTAPTPIREHRGDLDAALLFEEDLYCRSYDDDGLIKARVYAVHTVILPAWLGVDEWCRFHVDWKYTWGFGVDPTWPEAWQRGITQARWGGHAKVAVARLLATKVFRSEFRQNLRDQLVAWLETPAEERRHKTPFSERQWSCLITDYLRLEADRISRAIYTNAGISLDLGCPRPKGQKA